MLLVVSGVVVATAWLVIVFMLADCYFAFGFVCWLSLVGCLWLNWLGVVLCWLPLALCILDYVCGGCLGFSGCGCLRLV